MKRLSVLLLLFVPCLAVAQLRADTAVVRKLQAYMDRFPQSQLRDVYKFCFQDVFGVEHLLTDSLGAVRYIEYELSHSDTADWLQPLFYYPTGMNGNYIRIDINYVRKGIIPMPVFVSAMLRSAQRHEPVSLEQWRMQWPKIESCMRLLAPRPDNWEADSATIAQMLANGQYALHHSARYNAAYRQHYRIVRSDIFAAELLPYIQESETLKR